MRSVSTIPWDDSPAARREAERQGDRVVTSSHSLPPISVDTPIGHVSVPRRVIKAVGRHLWLWAGPLLLTALGTAYGYVQGYAKELSDAAERLTRIETRATKLGERMASVEVRVEGVERELGAETASNRAERATRDRQRLELVSEVEALKKAQPRIEGLAGAKK